MSGKEFLKFDTHLLYGEPKNPKRKVEAYMKGRSNRFHSFLPKSTLFQNLKIYCSFFFSACDRKCPCMTWLCHSCGQIFLCPHVYVVYLRHKNIYFMSNTFNSN